MQLNSFLTERVVHSFFFFFCRQLSITTATAAAAPPTVPIIQDNMYFMDSESFEEVAVPMKIVGDNEKWITEGMEISLVIFKDKVIEVVVPSSVVYEIVETEPNVKGNTAQGYTKPATLSSGAVINIPGYLEQGEMIKVDTDKGTFQERAK